MAVRLAMPILTASVIAALLSLFFKADPSLGVGPTAWWASVLGTSLMTLCHGLWLLSRGRDLSPRRIFVGAFLPVAAITVAIAPINAWQRFQHDEHLAAWCLVLLFALALIVLPMSWRITRQA
jgi:hypothetical protein